METIFSLEEFDRYRFPSQKLEQAAHYAHVDFRGWPFLFIHYNRQDCLSKTEDGLESSIETTDFVGQDMFDFWRFNESGLFYKKERGHTAGTKPPVASAPGIADHFAEAIFCISRLYQNLLSDSDLVTLDVTFFGTRGRELVWDNAFRFGPSGYVANRPEISVRGTRALADWRAGVQDIAVEMTQETWKHFQVDNPDAGQIRTFVQKLFSRRF